eukprot:CFRG8151T1
MLSSLLLVASFILSATQNTLAGSLYDDKDQVIVLTSSNFTSTVGESDKIWVIEFYSEWCGHCRHFAPTYISYAEEARPWGKYIAVGAVNCADERDLCNEHNIFRYPTIKFFTHPSPIEITKPHPIEFMGGRTVNDLLGAVAKTVFENWMDIPAIADTHLSVELYLDQGNVDVNGDEKGDDNAEIEAHVEQPSSGSGWSLPVYDERYAFDMSEEPQSKGMQGVEYILVVFEEKGDFFSSTIALDYVDSPSVRVYFGQEFQKEDMHVLKIPSIVMIQRSHTDERRVYDNAYPRKDLLVSLGRLNLDFPSHDKGKIAATKIDEELIVPLTDSEKKNSDTQVKLNNDREQFRGVKLNSDGSIIDTKNVKYALDVHSDDLRAVVGRIFFIEIIAMRKTLTPTDLSVLADFAAVVAAGFPLVEIRTQLQGLADAILRRSGKPMSDYEYQSIVRQELDSSLESTEEAWNTCLGSEPKYRGYTCGVWILLHSLSVNCDFPAQDMVYAVAENGRSVCGGQQILIVRDFIQTYFGCAECADHFSEAVARDEKDMMRWNQEQAALWLWRTHNVVNKRLQKSPSTDPFIPKVPFPPPTLCDLCISKVNTEDIDSFKWDDTKVYEFLKLYYGPSGIVIDNAAFTILGHDPLTISGLLLVLFVLYKNSGYRLKLIQRIKTTVMNTIDKRGYR